MGTIAGSVACQPQPSFPDCGNPTSTDNLSNCPDRCLNCYESDFKQMKSALTTSAITTYQPLYFLAKAASKQAMQMLLGTCDDTIIALGTSTSQGTCASCGSPSLCGSQMASALINGACRGTTPWTPTDFCEAKCKAGKPCTNQDCSCSSDADCGGTAGSCDKRGFYPAFKAFLTDGTIIGIQLGNEVLSASVNGKPLTKAQVVQAATTMQTALNGAGFNNVDIIVSLRVGNEQNFCTGGASPAPPTDVDLIAAHPYCNDVASVPPTWPFESSNPSDDDKAAQDCVNQVMQLYNDNAVKFCGAANTFIGETGYNTGCPGVGNETRHLKISPLFIQKIYT